VPRIGHDLMISPALNAASRPSRVPDAVRSATEVRTPLRSCACEAVSQRTVSVAVAKPGPAMRCAASLSSAISCSVITAALACDRLSRQEITDTTQYRRGSS
jgi:hypothetical protein